MLLTGTATLTSEKMRAPSCRLRGVVGWYGWAQSRALTVDRPTLWEAIRSQIHGRCVRNIMMVEFSKHHSSGLRELVNVRWSCRYTAVSTSTPRAWGTTHLPHDQADRGSRCTDTTPNIRTIATRLGQNVATQAVHLAAEDSSDSSSSRHR